MSVWDNARIEPRRTGSDQSGMVGDLFGSIFDSSFGSSRPQRRLLFSDVWDGGDNPVRKVGRAATESMRDLQSRLQEQREGFDGGALDIENYFGDLDALQEGLAQVAGTVTEFGGDPIRDRATLRATRDKALTERRKAKQILQSQGAVEHLEEKADYIDPMTGQVTELRGAVDNTTTPMGNLFNKGEQYFNHRFNELKSSNSWDDHTTMLAMVGADDDGLSRGNTDFIIKQMRAGFGELAGRAAAGQMQAYQAELQTRQQAAMAELEQRKKANITATATEKKKLKQVADIDKSITDINTMFVQTDAQFAANLKGGGASGLDFRADRPS